MLSIAMILFGANGIRDIHPRQWFKNKWWLLGIAWIAMYALSWFWSADKGAWGTRLEVKLPFLILPLAFSFIPQFTAKQLQIITLGMGLMFLGSAVYSISFLIRDSEHYITGYRYSHVLPTLPKNDHIRSSMAMVLFIIWSVYAWPLMESKVVKRILGIIIALLAIYIHILAAKTGIISLYLFLAAYGLYLGIMKRKVAGILLIIAIPASAFVALKLFPTFRERLNYIDFTYFMLKQGDKSGNIGDIARLMSYKIAGDVIKEHPLTGVGTGDMKAVMDEQYAAHYPDVPEYGRLLPHNQFLTVGLGCGIPTMLLFAFWFFILLRLIKRRRKSFFFLVVWLILLLQLMIEPVLEVQFGVFVFVFFLLLLMHEFPEYRKGELA
jgi:O-antigen ligase